MFEQGDRGVDVLEQWNIVETVLTVGEKRCKKKWQSRVFRAAGGDRARKFCSAIDYDELQRYRLRAKKLLRELRVKTHEDRLRHDPAYAKLTEKQKEELHAMLLEALQISLDEIGFPEGCIEHDTRSIPGLETALARVDAILENAGIDTRIELVIQGKTLREQLEWLQEGTKSLERRIESARAELHALATDMEPERMRQVLASPEQHERIQEAMKKKASEYVEKAERIEHDIDTLFKQDGRRAA